MYYRTVTQACLQEQEWKKDCTHGVNQSVLTNFGLPQLDNEILPVAMRSGVTPVPIPNTMVKT